MKLTRISDELSRAATSYLVNQGSQSVEWYANSDGSVRVCRSLDPSGDGGQLEHHVSVSKYSKPVKRHVILGIANQLCPGIRWQVMHGANASHVWPVKGNR